MPATFKFEKLTLDATTAQGTTSAKTAVSGKKAQKCIITVETNDARMKIDSVPTSDEGVLLKKESGPYEITGYDLISKAQFIGTVDNTMINLQYILI